MIQPLETTSLVKEQTFTLERARPKAEIAKDGGPRMTRTSDLVLIRDAL